MTKTIFSSKVFGTPLKCRHCGRYLGANLCECRITETRRQAIDGDNIQLLMQLNRPYGGRRELMVAEVAAEEYQ
jgi:hypothetical protein